MAYSLTVGLKADLSYPFPGSTTTDKKWSNFCERLALVYVGKVLVKLKFQVFLGLLKVRYLLQ